MTKIKTFQDIPQMTHAHYHCDQGWDHVQSWITRLKKELTLGLDMNPDFQRRYVWTTQQQIDYIEWCLKGGKSGREIYWNCPNWMRVWKGPMEIVDGKQRIQAVLAFINDTIKVFGRTCSQLKGKNCLSLLTASFSFNVNNLTRRSDVLQWYIDMNTGGTMHTTIEINNVQKLLKIAKREENCQ